MIDRKYYMDELGRYLVKAYTENGKYVLEIITLVPKYRAGYHRNVYKKIFGTINQANRYFVKIKENEKLKKAAFPGMANGHVEY